MLIQSLGSTISLLLLSSVTVFFVVASLLSLFATENYPPIFVVKGQDDVYNRHLSENEEVALSSPQIVELENGTTFELQTSKASNIEFLEDP
jgi:hypothetical protein